MIDALSKIRERVMFNDERPYKDEADQSDAFAKAVMTGDGHENYVKLLKKKLSKEQTEDFADFYRAATSFAIAPIYSGASKIYRTDNVTKEINHADKNALVEIEKAVSDFQPGMDYGKWLEQKLIEKAFNAPNDWLIIEQWQERDSGGNITDLYCYPVEVAAENVVNFGVDRRGRNEWLLVKDERVEIARGATATTRHSVTDYYLYQAGQTVIAREYVETVAPPELEGVKVEFVTMEEESGHAHNYQIETYLTGSKEFPGASWGVIQDAIYGQWVRRPFFYGAKPVFLDLIAHKAECDIAEIKHIFPKRWQFAPMCDFEDDHGGHCGGHGTFSNGSKCPSCKGSGLKSTHNSGMDIMYLPYARNADEAATMPKLSEVSYTEDVPVEMAKHYADAWERDAVRVSVAMYGTTTTEKAASPLQAKTATEVLEDADAKNNMHLKIADAYSQLFMLGYRLAAQYLGKDAGFEVSHSFRRDLKLENMDAMIARVKAAKEAGLPSDIVFSEVCSVMAKQQGDNPGYVEEIKAKTTWTPFASMSEAAIVGILAGRDPMDSDRIFWENQDAVWREVYASVESFAQVATNEAKQSLIDRAIEKVKQGIKVAAVEVQPFGFGAEPAPVE